LVDELRQAFAEYLKELERQDEEILKKYPFDVPNKASNKAVITGLFIENSFRPLEGDCIAFFELEYEKVFVWTQKENEYSVLLIEVDEKVKDKKCWITLASIIELSRSLWTSFERKISDDKLDYKWIYYFDPQTNIENSTFYGMSIGGPSPLELTRFSSGIVLKATDIAEMAHIIELLYRDEKAYTATANLNFSFLLNYCCLICETGSIAYHDHLAEEPKLWEHVSVIPEMEAAIVQACRAVEAILGEPPNRDKQTKVFAFKEKWKTLLGFEADSIFEKEGKSYFDFYYELFSKLRNPSAHSHGDIHYDLLKKSTVAAQCFASKILFEYINTHILDHSVAKEKLLFNNELLSRVSEEMSTKLTGKN
jgi:hypothetical protein